MRKEVGRAARIAHKLLADPDHPAHKAYRKLRNRYGDRIRQAKKDHWDVWISEANMKSVWTIGKYIRAGSGDGSRTSIPPIRHPGSAETTHQSKEKSKIFYETFFPAPPPAAARRIQGNYPADAFEFATSGKTAQDHMTFKSSRQVSG